MGVAGRLTIAAVGIALLAACSADTGAPLLDAVGLPGDSQPAGAITTEPPGREAFDPFGTADRSTGGREVIKDPTTAEVMQTGPLPEMSLGRADAPVTIIKYASLTCPFCRQFHAATFPELKRAYIDTGKVRFILREFPIGLQSGAATVALRCAPAERYFELYGKFLAQQARWVSQEVRRDPIFEIARQVGMTRAAFDACYQNQAMIDGLKWVKDRGRTLGVIGTPNFFVNGRLIKSVLTMKEIAPLVEAELSKPVAAAGLASAGLAPSP